MKTYAVIATVIACLLIAIPMLTGQGLCRKLTIMTHDSFTKSVLEDFKATVLTYFRCG